ncbi:MAG: hypothetical protein KKA60_12705 [Proteobacteria bacterium]|nr:hypothetical protein [Pseudomonadota bacterium]
MRRFIVFALALVMALAVLPGTSFSYDFTDAVLDSAADGMGAEAGLKFFGYLQKVSQDFQADDDTKEMFEFLGRAFKQFNLGSLYGNRQLAERDNGYRGITFAAVNTDGTYALSVLDPGETAPAMDTIGNFVADFGLKKNNDPLVGGRSYLAYMDVAGASEYLSHENINRLLTGMLRVLDPANVEQLAEQAVRDKTPGVCSPNYDIIKQFRLDFPRFMAYMDRYFTFKSVSRILSHHDTPYNHFKMTWAFNMDGLYKDFPRLAKGVENLHNLARIDGFLESSEGNVLLRYLIDTETEFFTLECYTREGKVVPVVCFGETASPVFDKAFTLTELTDYALSSFTDIGSQVKGLTFDTPQVLGTTQYQDTERDMRLYMHLDDIGDTTITGAAYHLFPVWLIDLFIPGNMDEIISDFTQVLDSGNGTKGAYMEFGWDTAQPDRSRFLWHGEAEFLDNFYVRFGMRILSDAFQADKRTSRELRTLRETALEKMLQDLTRMKTENSGARMF